MSNFTRNRSVPSVVARTVAAGALSLVAGGLLVACGGDDSSATGSPTTTTVVAPSPSKAPAKSESVQQSSAAPAPAATSQAESEPAEQPQAVPSDFPGPTSLPISSRGQNFLDALKKEGVTPGTDGVIAISTADYICAAEQAGSSEDEITTFVTAAVGSEASASGQEMSQDQATKNAKVYIRVAQASYCGK
ncbi:DUF732 domain-containing protein [Prescottella subtropica]|uniref:DUF732 domain-containing protein n=1 Tax=Prescottella subtropica TaxID=2545757 RepID=UPI0010FA3F2C|nr:DUF732 domain-containing protein [Prescottella subtropica]